FKANLIKFVSKFGYFALLSMTKTRSILKFSVFSANIQDRLCGVYQIFWRLQGSGLSVRNR
nr:hypothetical protein [Campylobacter sp.]